MKYLFRNWYKEIEIELEKSETLKIVSPFVSDYFFHKIKGKFNLSNIELVTRFNLKDFSSKVSSLEALKFLFDNGGRIYGVRNLHSKLYIFDEDRAILSSANITQNGLHKNYECGIFLKGKSQINELNEYFSELKMIAKNNLFTDAKYDDWKTKIANCEIVNPPNLNLEDHGATENDSVDKSRNYYVKFLGTGKAREPLTFKIEDEIDRALCHYAVGFSKNKPPCQINENDVIYLARLTKEPNDYSIFGKGYAINFLDKRDYATENEMNQRDWKRYWPLYLRLKNIEFINGTLGNCTLMSELMNELDYLSFESTKRKYLKGIRDINPKRSLSQQPYVKLSIEGANWIEQRFQMDKNDYGLISEEFLNSLPQPDEIVT